MSRSSDDCLYAPDAIEVGILIFGKRICTCCETPLPACTDYYAPDKTNHSGLVYECRRCRRALERDRWSRQRLKEVVGSGQLSLLTAQKA